MEKPYMILRRSVYIFLQHYHYFTVVAALLVLPYSASKLMLQVFTPSSALVDLLPAKLHAIFMVAGFPQSELLSVLSLRLSQSVLTASYTFPFTHTFLLVAKGCTIKAMIPEKPVFPSSSMSFVSLYCSLVHTSMSGAFAIVAANATAFTFLFLWLNFFEGLGFSSPNWLLFMYSTGAVAYSIILANVLVICNLVMGISGMEPSSSGFTATVKAFVLVSGKTSTALLLALLINLLLASVECLFHYRIVRGYHSKEKLNTSMACTPFW